MDHTLLLCLKTLLIHDNMLRHTETYTEGTAVLVSSRVQNNKYEYTLSLFDRRYHCVYSFNSNTFVFGSLDVTDCATGISLMYSVTRTGDTIRVYTTSKDYTEFHIYNKLNVITIKVVGNKKQLIGCFNLAPHTTARCGFIGNSVYAKAPSELDLNLTVSLFALTGAIDYDAVVCPDVVCFRSSRMLMTIYTDTHTQLIGNNTFPCDSVREGGIAVINSDFRQRYIYTVGSGNRVNVTEYVTTHTNEETIKRNYELHVQKNTITTDKNGLVFSSTLAENSVRFQRL